jgi:hypothetical protein
MREGELAQSRDKSSSYLNPKKSGPRKKDELH